MTQPNKPSKKYIYDGEIINAQNTILRLEALSYNHAIDEMDAYYQPILEEMKGALRNLTELIENCISDGEASKLIKKHYSYLGAKQALAKYKEIK